MMFLESDAGSRPLFLFSSTLPWRTVDIKSILSLWIASPTYFSFLHCMNTRSLRVGSNSFSMLSFEHLSVHFNLSSLLLNKSSAASTRHSSSFFIVHALQPYSIAGQTRRLKSFILRSAVMLCSFDQLNQASVFF